MRTLAVGQNIIKFNNFKSNENQPKVTDVPNGKKTKKPILTKENALPLVSAAVAVASLGVSAFAITKGKKGNNIKSEITSEAKKAAEDLVKDLKNKVEAVQVSASNTTTKIEELATNISKNKEEIAAKANWFDGTNNGIYERLANIEAKQAETFRPTEKNIAYVDGKALLQNVDNSGKRIELDEAIIKEMQETAQKFMTGKDATGAAVAIAALGAGSTVWLPTAESLPEKEGGLAEVPVQMAMNWDKMDINNYIVRPLIEIPGKTEFVEKEGKYYYYYPGLDVVVVDETTGKTTKKAKPLELEKVVSFETKVFRNGHYETQPVDVFYAEDTTKGYKRLMFRNKDYFNSTGLYNQTQMVSEAERYTFFNKAMYEFMKLKMDPKSVQGYSIPNPTLFESIKTPDAMVLNDWHCGPTAALMRYKSLLECDAKELNNDAAQRLKNMNLLYIVHNSDYQGDDWQHTSEIINTLFDKYALDVYENAVTGFTETYKDDKSRIITQPINSLYSTLMIDGNINMANMGMCLANKVKPVSKAYANEMATRSERARGLMHVTAYRSDEKHKTLQGASNGWDRVANEIAAGSKPYNDTVVKINEDIAFIKNVVMRNPDFVYEIPKEREVKPVSVDMKINEIMENRAHNKKMFVEYLKSSLEYNKAATEYNSKLVKETKKLPLINFDATGVSDLSDIDMDKLAEIPVLSMGVRFTEQKGVDIVAIALKDLYKNWETYYPGKERPIIVIGGQDKVGSYRKIAQNLKKELGEDGKRLLYMDGFTPNPTFFAGSDYTLRPSHFEPDGDKWESLYRGTPAIMTRVGGHIDSITDNYNGFLSKRTVADICGKDSPKDENGYKASYLNAMGSDYAQAIRRGLDAFYAKKPYQELVRSSIHGDQSWVQYEDGKIKECPLVGHMRDLGFDFNDPKLASLFADSVKK